MSFLSLCCNLTRHIWASRGRARPIKRCIIEDTCERRRIVVWTDLVWRVMCLTQLAEKSEKEREREKEKRQAFTSLLLHFSPRSPLRSLPSLCLPLLYSDVHIAFLFLFFFLVSYSSPLLFSSSHSPQQHAHIRRHTYVSVELKADQQLVLLSRLAIHVWNEIRLIHTEHASLSTLSKTSCTRIITFHIITTRCCTQR